MDHNDAIYRMRTLIDMGYTIRINESGTLSIIPPNK